MRGLRPVRAARLPTANVPKPTSATGFLDLEGTDSAMLVEWLDKIPQAAPRDYLRVTLKHTGGDARELLAEAFGARPAALLEAWMP